MWSREILTKIQTTARIGETKNKNLITLESTKEIMKDHIASKRFNSTTHHN